MHHMAGLAGTTLRHGIPVGHLQLRITQDMGGSSSLLVPTITTRNMVLVLSAVIVALIAILANAQDNTQNSTYFAGLVKILNDAGLTSFVSALGSVNSTGTGDQLLANLSNQKNNYTIVVPNNSACQSTSFRHLARRPNSNVRV